ncbi:MAG: ParA family protein [Anaerolineales bacterium]|nr:ParA family protein [Anaerolineales bacterium]
MPTKTKILAIANQKGGVGKTTTGVTLAAGLALRGYKTLLVDLDSQGHVSRALNLAKQDMLRRWFYDEEPLLKVIAPVRENFWVLQGDKGTDRVTGRIREESYGEELFAEMLRTQTQQASFDVVLLDLAPSISNLQIAALIAAHYALIPTRLRMMDIDGVQEILRSIQQLTRHGHQLLGWYILPTFFDRTTNETVMRLKELAGAFGNRVWPPILHDVKVSEAPGRGKTLWEYAPKCNALLGYVNGGGLRVGGYADTLERVSALLEGA